MSVLNRQFVRVRVVGRAVVDRLKRRVLRYRNVALIDQAARTGATLEFAYSSRGPGLGALYLHVLAIHAAASERGFDARVTIPRSVYSHSGTFDPLLSFWDGIRTSGPCWKRISFANFSYLGVDYRFRSLRDANDVWSSSYALKESLRDQLDAELDQLGLQPGEYVSVHYRGSDKSIEAITPNFTAVAQELEVFIEEGRKVFVASDDASFVDYIRDTYGESVVIPHHHRADGSTAIHHRADVDGDEAAREALLTMLCLAGSSAMVKTPSALSGFSLVLNPDIVVKPVGRIRFEVRDWFPDNLLFPCES